MATKAPKQYVFHQDNRFLSAVATVTTRTRSTTNFDRAQLFSTEMAKSVYKILKPRNWKVREYQPTGDTGTQK